MHRTGRYVQNAYKDARRLRPNKRITRPINNQQITFSRMHIKCLNACHHLFGTAVSLRENGCRRHATTAVLNLQLSRGFFRASLSLSLTLVWPVADSFSEGLQVGSQTAFLRSGAMLVRGMYVMYTPSKWDITTNDLVRASSTAYGASTSNRYYSSQCFVTVATAIAAWFHLPASSNDVVYFTHKQFLRHSVPSSWMFLLLLTSLISNRALRLSASRTL